MDIKITSFRSPFSFFCMVQDSCRNVDLLENNFETNAVHRHNIKLSHTNHGQYVAVKVDNKWTRGIINIEPTLFIWLIDYGKFLRPTLETIYVPLPREYKKYPSSVFEASIHGVTPMRQEYVINCGLENIMTVSWSIGSVEKAEELISNATKIYFTPVALLSTTDNDVVLGELHLDLPVKGIVNIIDEIQMWPVSMEKNEENYIKNLPNYYTSRRLHHACTSKPVVSEDLPIMTLQTSLSDYYTICSKAPKFDLASNHEVQSEVGSTVIDVASQDKNIKKSYTLTPAEIEKYCNMYVMINGREYNALNVFLNKIKDLIICERYKDHDLKSVGRGITYKISKQIKNNKSVGND